MFDSSVTTTRSTYYLSKAQEFLSEKLETSNINEADFCWLVSGSWSWGMLGDDSDQDHWCIIKDGVNKIELLAIFDELETYLESLGLKRADENVLSSHQAWTKSLTDWISDYKNSRSPLKKLYFISINMNSKYAFGDIKLFDELVQKAGEEKFEVLWLMVGLIIFTIRTYCFEILSKNKLIKRSKLLFRFIFGAISFLKLKVILAPRKLILKLHDQNFIFSEELDEAVEIFKNIQQNQLYTDSYRKVFKMSLRVTKLCFNVIFRFV